MLRNASIPWAILIPALLGLATFFSLAIFLLVKSRRSESERSEKPVPAGKPSSRIFLAFALLLLFLGLPLVFFVLSVFFLAPVKVHEQDFDSPQVVQPTAPVAQRIEETSPLAGPADRDFWLKTDAMAPEGERPKWVETDAESLSWSGVAFGIQARGRRPGPEGLLAGYSPDLSESASEALAEASRAAARHLVALAAATGSGLLRESGARRPGRLRAIPATAVIEAARAFEAEAVDLVAKRTQDRFVEEIAKPYGILFRAAVLVSVKPEEVRGLGERFRDLVFQKLDARTDARRQVLLTAAAALGMAVVVFLLYSFVNAGTKGYFAWPLRILSIGTLLLLYLGLMWALDWFPG